MSDKNKREPIVRVPITGLRQPIFLKDVAHPDMNWETQYKKLNNYIKFVAGQVVSGLPSAVMSAEDLYQEGLILLYTCFEKYKLKPENEFQALFKTSCWRLLKGFCYKKKEFQTVDLDEVFDMGYDDNSILHIYEEYKLQQVRDLLKSDSVALSIFNEIIEPSKQTCWEAEMDFHRKECLKAQGKRVFATTEVEIKPEMVRRGLKLPIQEFNTALKLVRSTVYSVYSLDTDIKSYQESDTMTDEEFNSIYGQIQNIVSKIA